MSVNIAELVEYHPQTASDIFNRLDGALNKVLPGITTPEHYERIGEVGLALVIGRTGALRQYSPFNPQVLGQLSFLATNKLTHPRAWEPKPTDEELLGGVIPEGMGRFTAFALAKINAMVNTSRLSSHEVENVSIAPGKVGLAGGIYIAQSLVAVSGLWEVHDHVAAGIFTEEMVKTTTGEILADRTDDDLAADIEPIFAKVTTLQEGVSADELSRKDVSQLLARIDDRIMPHYMF